MLGPPTKAHFIFAWINSINPTTWNYKIEFLLILKHLKKSWKLWNLHAKKKNGGKILLKMRGFSEPKHSKEDGKCGVGII